MILTDVTRYALLSDVTPNRGTVEAVGNEDACRIAHQMNGDDTWCILPIVAGAPELGERVYHDRKHGARGAVYSQRHPSSECARRTR